MFKYTLLLSFLIFGIVLSASSSSSSSSSSTCRAITFSGAGDRGAWETGVVMGIMNVRQPEDYRWQFVTGISAGSINAAAMAMFSVGDETSARDFLQNQWLTLTRENVYVNWAGGPLDGILFQTGLFDTTPLIHLLNNLINTTKLANSDRGFLIGASNIGTGVFDRFYKNDPNITLGVVASSSVPGVFPMIEKDGQFYCDGGLTVIRLCYDTGATEVIVDVILEGALEPMENVTGMHTIDVLLREGSILARNTHLKDIENVYMAFPQAKLNIYTPNTEKLPGYILGFQYSAEMIKIGIVDGQNPPSQNNDSSNF
ncbi:patatin family protein [Dictyostelium discoideum AX4]|uniref:Patatin family protein n=1 Tax=Dictyostelium discoideum TaxID=44689 RepID=B0G109_DICDI|nr:patatin family protein [Dictyostelium discoideum AX4]EDR41099.1 patatin family protein [Dictyostelium discoideum AX4]|eukprot:XP_001732971.1 patatin family protein [Dictyostelium discoideum AX4]